MTKHFRLVNYRNLPWWIAESRGVVFICKCCIFLDLLDSTFQSLFCFVLKSFFWGMSIWSYEFSICGSAWKKAVWLENHIAMHGLFLKQTAFLHSSAWCHALLALALRWYPRSPCCLTGLHECHLSTNQISRVVILDGYGILKSSFECRKMEHRRVH